MKNSKRKRVIRHTQKKNRGENTVIFPESLDIPSQKVPHNDTAAFCFLVTRDLTQEKLWQEWFEQLDEEMGYNIYVHTSVPTKIKSDWLKKYLVPFSVPTKWDDHMEAELALLNYALEQSNNAWFINLSETTIPMISAQEFADSFWENKTKTLLAYSKYWWGNNPNRGNVHKFPESVRLGNGEWCVLCNEDMRTIMYAKTHTEIINTIMAPGQTNADESIFSVTLKLCNNMKNVIKTETTLMQWPEPEEGDDPEDKKFDSPVLFTNKTVNEAVRLYENNKTEGDFYMFMRKIDATFPVETLRKWITPIRPKMAPTITTTAPSYKTMTNIIGATTKQPTLVNDESRFVVVTYWWGRSRFNMNTSRPCASFYEQLVNNMVTFVMDKSMIAVHDKFVQGKRNDIFTIINDALINPEFIKLVIMRIAKTYYEEMCSFMEMRPDEISSNDTVLQRVESWKKKGKIIGTYTYMPKSQIESRLLLFYKHFSFLIVNDIVDLLYIRLQAEVIKSKIQSSQTVRDEAPQMKILIERRARLLLDIKNKLSEQVSLNNTDNEFIQLYTLSDEDKIQNKTTASYKDVLSQIFTYTRPIKFEEMIANWEQGCEKARCNYLAVEYPEFAQPGGYQMAINAKPMFIKKALELCKGRGVLYIDGDMIIHKYPQIFDIENVDYMARGWTIDPRAGNKLYESILFDPYTFETSGGTMFFAQSPQAKRLLDVWIDDSSLVRNQKKADDRIISLLFNTYQFLLSINLIQLPIEYLWLTQSYNYNFRLIEDPYYDNNYPKLTQSIFIEHPECLTSEETANGAGAASDRTPNFYDVIIDSIREPYCEEYHEFILFPSEKMADSFKTYHEYMKGVEYLPDGSIELAQKGLEGEQPIYITDWKDKFGTKKDEEGMSKTDIYRKINRIAASYNINEIPHTIYNDYCVIRHKESKEWFATETTRNTKFGQLLVAAIVRLLKENRRVILMPPEGGDFMHMNNESVREHDLIFTPKWTSVQTSSIYINTTYKPNIDFNYPIIFCPGNRILTEFMASFYSLRDFGERLSEGCYEFVSRVRIKYLIDTSKQSKHMTGGSPHLADRLSRYNEGQNRLMNGIRARNNTSKKRRSNSRHRSTKKTINTF